LTKKICFTELNSLEDQAVTIVDVSPRDGLQARKELLSSAERAKWVKELFRAGIDEVEAGSFVHPGRVPQMAGTDEVLALLTEEELAKTWVLTPNMRGLEAAAKAGARGVVCLLSATETHSRDNLGRNIDEVLNGLSEIHAEALRLGVKARAALSMAWIDPTEGEVPVEVALHLCAALAKIGFDELTLCDTYGGASPLRVAELITKVAPHFSPDNLSLHLHDTLGTASANTLAGLICGIRKFETSIAGLGGCPFAPGARGNMDTAHLVHLLHSMGMKTKIDAAQLADVTDSCMALLEA
jgi:hydroxymethylglutaryl-CoA lyase